MLFDPAVYSQADMARMAQSAAQSALNQTLATNSTGALFVNVGGLQWRVIVTPGTNGIRNVPTAFPVGRDDCAFIQILLHQRRFKLVTQ